MKSFQAFIVVASICLVLPIQSTKQKKVQYLWGSPTSGDKLVAKPSQIQEYTDPTDITLAITYDGTAEPALITWVVVNCKQTENTVGIASLVGGGIGQNFFQMTVQALDATFLKCTYKFYAK